MLLTLGLHALVHRLVLTRLLSRATRWASLILPLLFLGVAWFAIERSGETEKERVQALMRAVVPTYAQEVERMGHAHLQPGVPVGDFRYQTIHEAMRRWLHANPLVLGIHTFRLGADGKTMLVMGMESGGEHEQEAPPQTASSSGIGEPYKADDALLAELMKQGTALMPTPLREIRGDGRLASYHPLRDGEGKLEAVLGVEFDAAQQLQAISRARLAATGYLAAFVLAAAMCVAAFGAWSLDRENRQHARTAAAMEESQRKLQDIINSIDGVVWEWDTAGEKYVFVSNHAAKLLGESAERWIKDNLFWRARVLHEDVDRVLAQRKLAAGQNEPYQCEYRMLTGDGRTIWVRERAGRTCGQSHQRLLRGVMTDVTLEKLADFDLEDLNKQLADTSRRAGMAEVASGVLHNVGNVLNSVNVSCTVIGEILTQSRVSTLARVAGLLHEQSDDLAGFFARDPRAPVVPRFIRELSDELEEEKRSAHGELQALIKNVAHIKHIVVMQQNYASLGGVTEPIKPAEVMEDAIRLHETALTRSGISIIREFDEVPSVQGDRNRVLQILVNLVRNATRALSDSGRPDKRLTLAIHADGGQRVTMSVIDNGTGISAEHLPRIFSYGFTTKHDGHGFGLHSGAAAAREMGGSLSVKSEGTGKGAAFHLVLPFAVAHFTRTPGLS